MTKEILQSLDNLGAGGVTGAKELLTSIENASGQGKTMGSVQECMIYWLDQSSVSSRRWVRFRFDSTSDCKKNYEFLD